MVFCDHPVSERSAVRRPLARTAWLLIGVLGSAAAAVAAQGVSQFTPFTATPRRRREVTGSPCRESDGQIGERVYDHVVNKGGKFEVHLGPRREFAIFK